MCRAGQPFASHVEPVVTAVDPIVHMAPALFGQGPIQMPGCGIEQKRVELAAQLAGTDVRRTDRPVLGISYRSGEPGRQPRSRDLRQTRDRVQIRHGRDKVVKERSASEHGCHRRNNRQVSGQSTETATT